MTQGMLIDVLDILLRSVLAVVVLFIITRLMGKRQIAQLTFFDYVVGITTGSIAATLTVDNTIAYSHGFIGLAVWGGFPILLSFISMQSVKARRILNGTPTILVQNGKIIKQNLKKERFTINGLLEDLRREGAFNIADVEFAILEPDGQLNVQKKSQYQPVTPSDLNISTDYEGLSANLVIDGDIMYEHLNKLNLNEEWLMNELKNRNIDSLSDVLLACLDTKGNLYVSTKNKDINKMDVFK